MAAELTTHGYEVFGIGSQPDWNLRASRSVPVHEQPPSGSGARP